MWRFWSQYTVTSLCLKCRLPPLFKPAQMCPKVSHQMLCRPADSWNVQIILEKLERDDIKSYQKIPASYWLILIHFSGDKIAEILMIWNLLSDCICRWAVLLNGCRSCGWLRYGAVACIAGHLFLNLASDCLFFTILAQVFWCIVSSSAVACSSMSAVADAKGSKTLLFHTPLFVIKRHGSLWCFCCDEKTLLDDMWGETN